MIPNSAERDAKTLWVRRNRGILTKLAKKLKVTGSAVHGVLYCHYNSPRIETALARLGAPHMIDHAKKERDSEDGLIEGLLADLGAPGMRERQKEAQVKSRGKQWTEAEKKRLTDRLRKLKTSGIVS